MIRKSNGHKTSIVDFFLHVNTAQQAKFYVDWKEEKKQKLQGNNVFITSGVHNMKMAWHRQ